MNLDDVREAFSFLESWEERYSFIIELGKELAPMDESLKTDATKVSGCMSQVWMVSRLDDEGRVRYLGDSDAIIVKGLIALLLVAYDGKTPQEVLDLQVGEVFDELGLQQHVSMNRRNGFFSMIERIQTDAARLAGSS